MMMINIQSLPRKKIEKRIATAISYQVSSPDSVICYVDCHNSNMFMTDNYYRVCLKSTPSSDYINASFIDVRLHVATLGQLMPSMSLKALYNVGIQAEKSLHCHPGPA